ncbi:MAG: trypsin-like serine protease [Bdellovibrionales bacterium]|nr:trypsin-like serine protease [Bdellovibrionales bacterium]
MRRLSTTLVAVALLLFMHFSNTDANQVKTSQFEPKASTSGKPAAALTKPVDVTNVNWQHMRGAIAISAARAQQQAPTKNKSGSVPPSPAPKLIRFLSSGVMISPTIGLTAAHSLENTVDVYVMEAANIETHTKYTIAKSYKLHPNYAGNNFKGIDLAIFELEKPMKLDKYFVPTALSNQALQNAVLQRVGFGERDTGDGEENRRTWILENYNRRITGENYLTSEDQYGYAGDSGGPVFRTVSTTSSASTTTDSTLELVGIHVGRMLGKDGEPVNESNTLILNPDIVAWIQKTAASFKSEAPAVAPSATVSNL